MSEQLRLSIYGGDEPRMLRIGVLDPHLVIEHSVRTPRRLRFTRGENYRRWQIGRTYITHHLNPAIED